MEQREIPEVTVPAGGSIEIGLRFEPSGRMGWLVKWLMGRNLVHMEPVPIPPGSDPGGVGIVGKLSLTLKPVYDDQRLEAPPEYGPMPPHGGKLN